MCYLKWEEARFSCSTINQTKAEGILLARHCLTGLEV